MYAGSTNQLSPTADLALRTSGAAARGACADGAGCAPDNKEIAKCKGSPCCYLYCKRLLSQFEWRRAPTMLLLATVERADNRQCIKPMRL
jgi:hypothetical protein